MNAINLNPNDTKEAVLASLADTSLDDVLKMLHGESYIAAPPSSPEITAPEVTEDSADGGNIVHVEFGKPASEPTVIEAEPVEPETPAAEAVAINEAASPFALESKPAAPVTITRSVKMTVDRAALAGALATVGKAAERRSIIPILSHVLLTSLNGELSAEATNLDHSIRVTMPASGDEFAMALPADTLAKIIGAKKTGTVEFSGEERSIVTTSEEGEQFKIDTPSVVAIVAGNSRFSLAARDASEFPILDTDDPAASFDVPADVLCRAFRDVAFAISTEETHYYLNGAFLHAYQRLGQNIVRMVATDGHRLACADVKDVPITGALPDNGGMGGVIIPRGVIALVQSLLGKSPKAKRGEHAPSPITVKVEVSDTKIRFTAGNICITSKLIDGTFPDYQRVIPDGNDKVLHVDATELANALDVVTAIKSDRGPAVKLTISPDGELTVSANNPELGSASERIGCIYRGDALEIGFNANYLAEIIGLVAPSRKRKAGEDRAITIRLSDAGGPALITGPIGPMTVLMPYRL